MNESLKTVLGLLANSITKVPELGAAYMKLQQDAMELMEQNVELREQVTMLKDQLKLVVEAQTLKGRAVWRDNHIYIEGGDEHVGPYCAPCWEVHRRLVHVIDTGTYLGMVAHFTCPACHGRAPMKSFPPKP